MYNNAQNHYNWVKIPYLLNDPGGSCMATGFNSYKWDKFHRRNGKLTTTIKLRVNISSIKQVFQNLKIKQKFDAIYPVFLVSDGEEGMKVLH